MSFVAAMKKFFGYRPGEGVRDFMKELKAVDNDDKKYFYNLLKAEPTFENVQPPIQK
jgi:hypothetical protein